MTDGEATEWVTIKIPAEIRAKGRSDPRTYGEIMQDGLDYADVVSDEYEQNGGGSNDVVSGEIVDQLDATKSEVEKALELLEKIPERTADEFERKYR